MVRSLKNERWKPIVGYDGLYRVSTKGRIMACEKTWVSGRNGCLIRHKPEALIMQSRDVNGYKVVGVCKDGQPATIKVHRAVASAFIKNRKNKPQVNHINGIKDDNVIGNLEWSNSSENQIHAYKLGLSVPIKGESHGRAKLSMADVIEIRRLYDTGIYTHTQISEKFNIHREYCAKIIRHEKRKDI